MKTNSEYVKCECWSCGNNIEFNVSCVDEVIGAPMVTCPICFKATQLYVPESPLTIEATQFLETLTPSTAALFVSNKLKRMALANGIGLSASQTATDIIRALFVKQFSAR